MTEAVMNIGLFKIAPGRARTVQISNRSSRYNSRLNVFQFAFFAIGTLTVKIWSVHRKQHSATVQDVLDDHEYRDHEVSDYTS